MTLAERVEIMTLYTWLSILSGPRHDMLLLLCGLLARLPQGLEHGLIVGRWRRGFSQLGSWLIMRLIRVVNHVPLLSVRQELANLALLAGRYGGSRVRNDRLVVEYTLGRCDRLRRLIWLNERRLLHT